MSALFPLSAETSNATQLPLILTQVLGLSFIFKQIAKEIKEVIPLKIFSY